MAKLDVPSVRALYDSFIADYESRTGQKTPLLTSALVRMFAWPFAGLTVLCYRFGQWVYFQMFIDLCGFEALKLYGSRVGVDYKDGSSCVASATLTGVSDTVPNLDAGTTFTNALGLVYQTTVSTPVSGGVAVATVTALDAGVSATLNIGDKLSLTAAPTGVPETAIVNSVAVSGEDPETIDEYRARVKARYRLRPQGGAPADYFLWGTEVDGIVDIFPYVVKPGITTCYVVQSGSGAGRRPDAGNLASVEEYIRKSPDSAVRDRHPVQAELKVLPVNFLECQVAISGLDAVANTNQNREDIKAAIVRYLDTRKPQVVALNYTAAQATISEAEVSAAAVEVLRASPNSGAFESLEISVGGVPLPDNKTALNRGTLANLESLTINGTQVYG